MKIHKWMMLNSTAMATGNTAYMVHQVAGINAVVFPRPESAGELEKN